MKKSLLAFTTYIGSIIIAFSVACYAFDVIQDTGFISYKEQGIKYWLTLAAVCAPVSVYVARVYNQLNKED